MRVLSPSALPFGGTRMIDDGILMSTGDTLTTTGGTLMKVGGTLTVVVP
jgi:hypothetical protein